MCHVSGPIPAPWDLGRPQPAIVRVAAAGAFAGAVLDAGCGSGENALHVATLGLPVLGVDVAETALAMARERPVSLRDVHATHRSSLSYNPRTPPESDMNSNARLAGALLVSLLTLAPDANAQRPSGGARLQPSETCDLAGLSVTPGAGWVNIPIQGAPGGHLGCQMARTNERDEVVAIIRVRSAAPPAKEFAEDDFIGMLTHERTVLERMGYALADQVLWTRDNVPVKGPGFRDARAFGVAGEIEGNGIPQEAHFLLFRNDSAKYLFTLLTPAKVYNEKLYERNTEEFGVLIRALKAR